MLDETRKGLYKIVRNGAEFRSDQERRIQELVRELLQEAPDGEDDEEPPEAA